jgi:hypothetical protein
MPLGAAGSARLRAKLGRASAEGQRRVTFDVAGFLRFGYLWLFRSPWTRRRALVAAAFLLFLPFEMLVRAA